MVFPDFEFEKSLLPKTCHFLLGIDEVGRGPLAGPLCLTGFLLDLSVFNPAEFIKHSVRDSKLLTAAKRSQISQYLTVRYRSCTVSVDSPDLDKHGLSSSMSQALIQILDHFSGQFDYG